MARISPLAFPPRLLALALMAAVLTLLALGSAAPDTASAQPSGWPASWTFLRTDPIEGGCNSHRNVANVYAATDSQYLYLRMENASAAGWPSTGVQGEARYKWVIDTVGGDIALSGGSIVNGEFALMVEDLTNNANDPNGPRDQLGEITLMDAIGTGNFSARWDTSNPPKYTTNTPSGAPSPSPWWRRALGSGVAGVGGLQGVMAADVGYRVTGNYVDMYVSLAALGWPANVQTMWDTDNHSPNLDSAPNCDKDDTGSSGIPVPVATATPTDTPAPDATATYTLEPGVTPTDTPVVVATATPVGYVGGVAAGRVEGPAQAVVEPAAAPRGALWALALAALPAAALLGWVVQRRRR